MIDFGPVATAGAFRLDTTKAAEWVLTPLPNSLAFTVEIRLDQFGGATAKVTKIHRRRKRKDLDAVGFGQTSDRLRFQTATQRPSPLPNHVWPLNAARVNPQQVQALSPDYSSRVGGARKSFHSRPTRVRWEERSESHEFSGKLSWWDSLRSSPPTARFRLLR